MTASDGAAPLQLYAKRKKLYPKSVHGDFRRAKWILMAICLGIYYILPFIRWDRGPQAPSQAVLIDFPARKFYFFFIEIWPQELYYITGLLILAAFSLFLMNALAGRIWCGYLCPQTVWTDLYYAVERFFEGDRRERMLADKNELTVNLVLRRAAKHAVWVVIAMATGGAWVLYFADAPTLVYQLATFSAPTVAYAWIGIFTFTTYTLAGHAREQVCTYMCPWPRIQAALTDEHALNVMYRYDRGEPRESLKEAERDRKEGKKVGDCIDCGQCVAVCPTGVDIRQGANLACIQCGLCIDACDEVMHKIGREPRLISYDTEINVLNRMAGKAASFRPVRPRTIMYAVLIAIVGLVMAWQLATRSFTILGVLHDRNPLFVPLADGSIRNSFTLHVSNKREYARTYLLSIEGLTAAKIDIVGVAGPGGAPLIEVGPDQVQDLRVLVTAPRKELTSPQMPIKFRVLATDDGERALQSDVFQGPANGR